MKSIQQLKNERGLVGAFYIRKVKDLVPEEKKVKEIPTGTLVLLGGKHKLGHVIVLSGENKLKYIPFAYDKKKVWEIVDEREGDREWQLA